MLQSIARWSGWFGVCAALVLLGLELSLLHGTAPHVRLIAVSLTLSSVGNALGLSPGWIKWLSVAAAGAALLAMLVLFRVV